MMLTRQNLGMSVIPGITQLTPAYSGRSARLTGGMGFGLGAVDPATGFDLSAMSVSDIADAIQKGMMILNSQQVFEINLQRLQNGLPPIPTQYASPSFNLGIAGVSMPMLLLGGGLLLFLLARR